MLPVDLVRRLETHYTIGAANRTAAGRTEMIPEAARDVLLLLALTAFIDRHVAEALEEGSVDSAESFTALRARHLSSVITQFAEAAQAARQ